MIVNINNGVREPIESVAREAGIRISGDTAVITVLREHLLGMPRAAAEIEFADGRWRVDSVTARTNVLISFECTRIN